MPDSRTPSARTVLHNAATWFVAADVGRELGYRQPENFIRTLDPEERDLATFVTAGGRHRLVVVSRIGALRTIEQRLLSKSDDSDLSAKIINFRDFITSATHAA